MTSLCHRALGDRPRALAILRRVLGEIGEDPWRVNPLIVTAWLKQDEGNLEETENLLREALSLLEKQEGDKNYVLIAQTLADFGEVLSLRGKHAQAEGAFRRSLDILSRYRGQYQRQEARTALKYAQALSARGNIENALDMLNRADNNIRYGGYQDLLWRIELARAIIYVRQRRFALAMRKVRTALRIRRGLGLPDKLFVQQLIDRFKWGVGLSR